MSTEPTPITDDAAEHLVETYDAETMPAPKPDNDDTYDADIEQLIGSRDPEHLGENFGIEGGDSAAVEAKDE